MHAVGKRIRSRVAMQRRGLADSSKRTSAQNRRRTQMREENFTQIGVLVRGGESDPPSPNLNSSFEISIVDEP